MKIHLIEKRRQMRPQEPGSSIWLSGDWTVSEEKAQRLIGGTIHFHEKQNDPSYFGGIVKDFQVLPSGSPNAGKVVFIFERTENAIGVRTTKDGWGNEQKTDE
jgi:hypothetical protein